MAKKKTKKVASHRGVATVSTPSKKPSTTDEKVESTTSVTPAVVEIEQPPTAASSTIEEQQDKRSLLQEQKDPLLNLAKKYESLNDHKAQLMLDRLTKNDSEQALLEERPVKKFRLSADIEKTLLPIVNANTQHGRLDGQCSLCYTVASQQAKEKGIAQLDVLYRTLLKLGFDDCDIVASFSATLADTIEEHLDWLCVHVPYERMPVGFFDKYFKDEEDDALILVHNAQNGNEASTPSPSAITTTKEQDIKVTLPERQSSDRQDKAAAMSDIKARILQAAQDYMDEEEIDVNEQYASLKLQLSVIEKQSPNNHNAGKKGKKPKKTTTVEEEEEDPPKVLSDAEWVRVQKDIRKLKDKMASLEADWDFDPQKAMAIYHQHLEKIANENRQRQIEARALLKKQKQEEEAREELKKEAYVIVDHDTLHHNHSHEEEDEEGLFGGLLMGEEEEEAALTTNPPSMAWNIIDLDLPTSSPRRLPKDALQEHCRKHHLGKSTYTSTLRGTNIWTSALILHSVNDSTEPLSFELPEGMAATTQPTAEQLIAIYALFKLEPMSSIYKIFPACYQDVWSAWAEEKRLAEEAPRLEADKRRFALLTEIVEKAYHSISEDTDKKEALLSTEDPTVKQEHAMTPTKSEKQFAQVRANFKSRLDKKEYLSMKEKRQTLPIYAQRNEILELVRHHQVLILSGETGCGKSTQVPQFLAEDLLLGAGKPGTVICTQPRRISAMSIANRVSLEMGDRPRSTGSRDAMVGYQIRLESKMSAENVLLFCTTGILLRRLESDTYLNGVTHVVVDEVHERTLESDFLLIVLKKLMDVRRDLKVILMSATVEASRFSHYFGGCPVISVPGRTYPVHVRYLEDVIEETGYVLEEDSRFASRRSKIKTVEGHVYVSGGHGTSKKVHYDMFEEDSDDEDPYDPTRIESKLTIDASAADVDEEEEEKEEEGTQYSRQTRKTIKRMDDKKINYDLILQLLDYICHRKGTAPSGTNQEEEPDGHYKPTTKANIRDKGAILVFLPGINEIRQLYDLVSSHHDFGDPKKYWLIALHSTLSSEHQEKAFEVPPDGIRKIVFSTNIAETGVTISDVTIVIDTGMARVVSYDDKKRVSRLLQKYVAKANARQRRGRAGRVQEGICFHLFTQERFTMMPDYETPEILRLPLEELCLRIKVCKLGSIRDVLGAALDAPSEKMINNAILTLQEVQALTTDGKESLTPLGAHLSHLPVDVHIGKMILFGAIFRCLDPILTIAAALSFKSPFIRPFGKEDEADAARARFQAYQSDFLTIYKAYTIWRDYIYQLQEDNVSKSSLRRKLRAFCKENFLSEQNLEMIEDMKRQYLGLLVSIGFVRMGHHDRLRDTTYDLKRSRIQLCEVPQAYDVHSYSVPVVNAALTAGLYPKLAEYLRPSQQFMNKSFELQIHPSSVLFQKQHTLLSDFLVYHTVVMNKTGNAVKDKIFMWETASVDAVAVILLSTDLRIKHKQRRIVLDDWLQFDCFARTAVLLKYLRAELNNLLAEKMVHPDMDFTHYNEEVMHALVQTLESGAC
ncbi:hypothetical protein BDF20DRAFT_912195 [Mycotypha africana]|uniref:uncharacterized protein n=1 Tax=Mycotypha africana TaxID=64632 RepID=UPI002300B601|nr:uncharacterized protein BDF20DRAFT_912195 [Mycotypha africana]KAI8981985.1 hypothetical protein BDF20DRAFT_912195 [Mycotypha africana]